MRRTSLSETQARRLGDHLRSLREQAGLTMRRLEAASGVNIATLVPLERGHILTPQVDTLRAVADALGVPLSDLFTVAGWLPPDELPTLKPYLRAKYQELDEQSITELERYADDLARRHGGLGPIDHEDETPD